MSISLESCIFLFCLKVLSVFSGVFMSFVTSMEQKQKGLNIFAVSVTPSPTTVATVMGMAQNLSLSSGQWIQISRNSDVFFN